MSQISGDYIFRFLPPGDYLVRFELSGFQTVEATIRVNAAQTTQLQAELPLARLAEEIVVTGALETVSTSSQSAITYQQDLIESLPVARNLQAAVLLSPGVTAQGPRGGITIAGSQSYENLFMVNGVVVNENIRGQALDLFIEDAIQETTTTVSGVSAEYGRFAGGVVNTLTKSGGNQFSGSFRVSVTNDDWISKTPVTTSRLDDINQVYEATLGGFMLKDQLWFFVAGRDFEFDENRQFYNGVPYTFSREQRRYEAKLTFSPHAAHRLVGSYIWVDDEQFNNLFYTPLEPSALDPGRATPQTLLSANYTGAITDNLFLEAQYSKRQFTFENSGGKAEPGDRINGTNIYFYWTNTEAGSPMFCATCGDETRDNENYLLKGSYFLPTQSLGSHELVFGYDYFNDMRQADNFQTPSNFRIWNYNDPLWGPDGRFYPVFTGGEEIDYWPIFVRSQGTSFKTKSIFINDTWRVNDKLTLSIGARYDKNDGTDGAGQVVADDSRISPRLGATYSLKGGEYLFHASFGRYVTALANSVADSAGGGTPSYFGYEYQGPPINVDGDGNPVPMYDTREALALLFAWFDSVGGLANTDLWYANPAIRGVNLLVSDLKSPYVDEISVGFTKRFGSKGLFRADYVRREFGDFYATQRDLSTGRVTATVDLVPGVSITQPFDLGIVVNDNSVLRREYDGLHTMAQYRLTDRLTIGGTWTWSHARGNFNGETAGAGPVSSGHLNYPEYQEVRWALPTGSLAIDQRHRIRAWGVYEIISARRHSLSASILQNFNSGSPYGAFGDVPVVLYVDNPGYLTPPTWQPYYFENRDAYTTDDVYSTDISFNYAFKFDVAGSRAELFIQPEVLNVFNHARAVGVDTTIRTWRQDRTLQRFDPFTETPVEGVHWYKGPNFGKPTTEAHYQNPRTFRVSFGLRF